MKASILLLPLCHAGSLIWAAPIDTDTSRAALDHKLVNTTAPAAAIVSPAVSEEVSGDVEDSTTALSPLPEEDVSLSGPTGDFGWLSVAGIAAVFGAGMTAIFVPLKHAGAKDPRLH